MSQYHAKQTKQIAVAGSSPLVAIIALHEGLVLLQQAHCAFS